MLDIEFAYESAKKGWTNVEIFTAMSLSSGELKRILSVNHELIFKIIAGRRAHVEPFIDGLIELAMGTSQVPNRSLRAILEIIQRMDNQNHALTVAYEMVMLEQAPALLTNFIQMSREEVTNKLKVVTK